MHKCFQYPYNLSFICNICPHLNLFIFTDVFSSGIWEELKRVKDPELKELSERLPPMALASCQDKTVRNYLAAFNKWKNWCSRYDKVNHLPAKAHYVALLFVIHMLQCL